jgi:hypothetical protein
MTLARDLIIQYRAHLATRKQIHAYVVIFLFSIETAGIGSKTITVVAESVDA